MSINTLLVANMDKVQDHLVTDRIDVLVKLVSTHGLLIS